MIVNITDMRLTANMHETNTKQYTHGIDAVNVGLVAMRDVRFGTKWKTFETFKDNFSVPFCFTECTEN